MEAGEAGGGEGCRGPAPPPGQSKNNCLETGELLKPPAQEPKAPDGRSGVVTAALGLASVLDHSAWEG